MLPAGDDKPTVLKLMRMKKQDGSDLNLFATIAGNCNIESFGMFLLSDDNGSEVKVLEADYARKGTEAFVKSIITKWLMKCSPAAPCTYVHLEQCLREVGLGALADDLAAIVRGVLHISGLYNTVHACVRFLPNPLLLGIIW